MPVLAHELVRKADLKGLADLSEIEGEPMPRLAVPLAWSDVEEWLRSDIARTLTEANAETLDRMVDGTRRHARRRAHEMTDAAALLDQLGVPSTIARAAATSLERIDAEQKEPVV